MPRRFNHKLIQALRTERGLSVAQVAEGLGKSPQLIRYWEKGAWLPNMESLHGLMDYFRVPESYFFEEDLTLRKAGAAK